MYKRQVETRRRYPDKRYTTHCPNAGCREPLMPYMRYCPWCRGKVRKAWKIAGSRDNCSSCGWGIASEFWDYCAWCSKPVDK